MKNIYVVIIKNSVSELSTVAFTNIDSAIDYCMDDICEHDPQVDRSQTLQEGILSELEEQLYFESQVGDTYWIEETTLNK
jgi:hypothetical protein